MKEDITFHELMFGTIGKKKDDDIEALSVAGIVDKQIIQRK